MEKVDDFEQCRIQQLLKQFGLFERADFWIVFGTLGNEARLDYSSWSISTNKYISYKESGFFDLFQHLLDIFIQYRSQHKFSDNYHGIISIGLSTTIVEWVDEYVAEMAIAALKENENDNS
jgi:hypothetical protein